MLSVFLSFFTRQICWFQTPFWYLSYASWWWWFDNEFYFFKNRWSMNGFKPYFRPGPELNIIISHHQKPPAHRETDLKLYNLSLDLVKWIYAVSVIPAQRCHMYLFLATWYRPWITDRVRIKHIYFLTIFAIQHFLQNTKKRHLNSIYIVEIMFVMYMNSVFSWLLPSWI